MDPEHLRYTKEHEWVSVEGDIGTIGITFHAQKELGDIVYVDLPKPGTFLQQHKTIGSVESVKAVSDLYSPIDGQIVEVNSALPDKLETLGTDPYTAGWIVKIKLSGDVPSDLLDYAAYQKQCAEEGH